MSIPAQEGKFRFHGYETWYRIVGKDERGKYPLICVHGGPGVPHESLKTLERIAESGRRVIFYDQLGCGNSDRPENNDLWSIGLFKQELATLIKELKIQKYHLLGYSWGGILALEHVLDHPQGLQTLILASTTASMSQWISELKRLRSELPQDVQNVLDVHESAGTIQSDEYKAAVMKFNSLHFCRLDPKPTEMSQALSKMGASVYFKMWGANEFTVMGTLKEWDVRKRLYEIKVPTLITSGKYDESTPLINQDLKNKISESQWVLFEKSSHVPHFEEIERYIKVLSEFLEANERVSVAGD